MTAPDRRPFTPPAAVTPTLSQAAQPGGPGAPPLPSGRTFRRLADALDAVLAERERQVERFGHTPQADAARPLAHFTQELTRHAIGVRETATMRPAEHALLRRRLVKLTALALATIERLDDEEGQP